MANLFARTSGYSPPTGTDSDSTWSTPGSAAPRPALSMIGQLRSPFFGILHPIARPILRMIGQLRSPFVASYKVLLYLYSLTDFSLRNFDMADNYLENQYEAYLARKAAKERQKRLLFKKQLKAYKERLARENATAADDVVTEPQRQP